MALERWYPSVTPLKDGEMLITEGGRDVPEVRQKNGTIRSLTSASLDQPLYPWLDVAPDGRAFYSGPDNRMASLTPAARAHGRCTERVTAKTATTEATRCTTSARSSSPAAATRWRAPDDQPEWSEPAGVANGLDGYGPTAAQHHGAADGTVLATGGNSSGAGLVDINNGVYAAELWNPATGTWRTLASEQVTRQYHSTALLLPDGGALSSGGGICGACDSQGYLAKNAQVFSPPYLFRNDGSGDLARDLRSLPRPGRCLQRALHDQHAGSELHRKGRDGPAGGRDALGEHGTALRAPVVHGRRREPHRYRSAEREHRPAGYYMLFVIGTDGVPSVASMVRVENETHPPRPRA